MALSTIPQPLAERIGPTASDSLVDVINRANEDVKKDVPVFIEERVD